MVASQAELLCAADQSLATPCPQNFEGGRNAILLLQVLTALAFKHFKGEGVDVAIIEVCSILLCRPFGLFMY